ASSTSIKVLDIDPKPLEIDDETYYLVKHNHGVSFLRTDASEIKQILEFKEALSEKTNALASSDFYLNIRVVNEKEKRGRSSVQTNITPEMKEAFEQKFKLSPLSVQAPLDKLDLKHFLTITDSAARFVDIVMFIVAVVFFVIVFAWQIVRVRRIKKHYARFDEFFPDYQYDMKRLLDDAEYLDEKLGVLVKDGILVSYGTEFRVVDLEEAVSASVLRQKSKWGGKYRFTFFNGGRKQVEEVPLGDLKDNIIDLVHYLREVCSYNVYIQF
ncbi:MAG: hypothetical protein HXO99_06095, partial [Streptococcus sp.]|nr:hypothetical protein [Streptococcus sp.]